MGTTYVAEPLAARALASREFAVAAETKVRSRNCGYRLLVLAPQTTDPIVAFPSAAAAVQSKTYEDLLAELQRLRASCALKDGAIHRTAVTPDGRHATPLDPVSWHLILTGPTGRVLGSMRYTIYPTGASFDELPFRDHPLLKCSHWAVVFRQAVEAVRRRAWESGRVFAQAGMWVLAEEARRGPNAVRMVLATFALAQLLGDCYAVCTATLLHHSASILRRLGAQPLRCGGMELPVYFDPHYHSEMQLLLFDSRQPNPRYAGTIAELQAEIRDNPVILPGCC